MPKPSEPDLTPTQRWKQALRTYKEWQHTDDAKLLAFTTGAFIANKFDSDPVNVMIVGGPGSGKTELLRGFEGLDNVYLRSTLTEAGLLSGVPTKDHAKGATGGLLKQIGSDQSIVIVKDFGSILSMSRHLRSGLLQALRDITDGSWSRQLGTEGGSCLDWHGKVGFMCATTGNIDQHHNAISAMGERFLYYRLPEADGETRIKQARSSIAHIGKTGAMRTAMKNIIRDLFNPLPDLPDLSTLSENVLKQISALADLASLSRSVVERDWYSTDKAITDVPDPEHGTRLAQALALLYGGMIAIGVSEVTALEVLQKVTLDSIPPLRRVFLERLHKARKPITLAGDWKVGRNVLKRCSEDLHALGLVKAELDDEGQKTFWSLTPICCARFREAGF